MLKLFWDAPSIKISILDDEDRALAMLEEAFELHLKRIYILFHQCGFASCDCGNELGDGEQWKNRTRT